MPDAEWLESPSSVINPGFNYGGAGLTAAEVAAVAIGEGVITPWRLTAFGDSRANFQAAGFTSPELVGATGAAFDTSKAPCWAAAIMGDAEYVANHGISGAVLSDWSSTSRANGKTFADLASRALDGVHIQYGVNDMNNASTTTNGAADTVVATMVTNAKAMIGAITSLGLPFVFETAYPCQSAGWAANPSVKQYGLDAFNAQMVSYINSTYVPSKSGAIADSATALKQGDGYADASYYLSGTNIHLNQAGARRVGAIVATAWRTLLPRKTGPIGINGTARPSNLIPHVVAATNIANNDTGTGTATTGVWGVDPLTGENYFETTWTPTTLTSGAARVRIMMQASVGAASSQYSLAGTETLAGAARVVLDDGSGGAPNANNLDLRQRLFAAGTTPAPFFVDWGGIGNAGIPDFDAPVSLRLWTPRVANTSPSTTNAVSQVTAPAGDNTGYGLYLLVEAQRTGAPCRIRIYPALRKVN